MESLEIRLLGPLSIRRNGIDVELPASRKVRGLLGYLALAPRAFTRAQLCELLWDVPNDPRGELRWSLSKIRRLVDNDDSKRVDATSETVRLNLTGCFVDAREVAGALEGSAPASDEDARELEHLFSGDFLEGLEIDRAPAFGSWLTAQRRRFRAYHVTLLKRLAEHATGDVRDAYLEKWLELEPFDRHAHDLLLRRFARAGRIAEGDDHVAATVRSFEAEGLDGTAVLDAWKSAREERDTAPAAASEAHRASVAVMPFTDWSQITSVRGGAADALAHDVITRLAKLRTLFVIAQGSVFALFDRRVSPNEAGRMLDVDYVTSGSVRRDGNHITVTIELAETRTAHIIWSEVFHRTVDDAFAIMDEIADSIVASIASEIEMSERNRAILQPPNSLDAWEAHHRGLWHMYRFNRADNESARHFFEMAVRLDPTFARAYAGLSFTHFQNVFQGWEPRETEIARALETAGQSVMADDRDPAAHWAMGRALWLGGQTGQAIGELDQAIDLSPNFALGHYALSFVQSQSGDPSSAIVASDRSRRLSPFDPLLFAMLGARAMALARMGRYEEAAEAGVAAAARPNAHVHIKAIAALTLALADRVDDARTYLGTIRRSQSSYAIDDFVRAMHFDSDGESLFRKSAALLGL